MSEKQTIGFIGIGIMGRPMSKHLLNAGYKLVVYDINRDAVKDVVSAGAEEAYSPRERLRRKATA